MKIEPLHLALLLVAGAAAALSQSACLGADATATVTFNCPSKATFTGEATDGGPAVTGVSAYMERRCGSLDCHGSTFRPMRIFGRTGLRDPSENNKTGGNGTTPRERDENYSSVCTLEPEKMSEAVDNTSSADKLLVLQKARGIEGHKGGTVVAIGSNADSCLLGWLQGDPRDKVSKSCQCAIDSLDGVANPQCPAGP